MKKIAIIATSNSFISDGYGHFLSEAFPGQVDNFGLGATSSVSAVFSFLQYQVAGNYDYVIFDFCINDLRFLYGKRTNKYVILSYWAFILKELRKTKTTPIFLLLPVKSKNRRMIDLYIDIAHIFNVEYIDMSLFFDSIPQNELFRDDAHFTPTYQKEISNQLSEVITKKPKRNINWLPCKNNLRFYRNTQELSDRKEIVGSSIRKMPCYIINTQTHNDIVFNNNDFIVGMLFWNIRTSQFDNIYIHNKHITIQKNFNISFNGFFAREIASNLPRGIKNPIISFKPQITQFIELTMHQAIIKQETLKHLLYVNSILLCNFPPYEWGERFYQRYSFFLEKKRNSKRERENTFIYIVKICAGILYPKLSSFKAYSKKLYKQLINILD